MVRERKSIVSKILAASSWSSGKDSCFACYKAIESGYDVKYLLNFVSHEFKRVSFHGVPFELVKLQSESIDIPLIQKEVKSGEYEKTFREALGELKSKGISSIVAGDIFLLDCRNWVEKICEEEGLEVLEPLWDIPSEQILNDFVVSGFKAVVTATQAKLLDQSWIGRFIDEDFIRDLKKVKGIDLCGENGEYHTFIFDGPIFKQKIEITDKEKVQKGDYNFLDIKKYKLINKRS